MNILIIDSYKTVSVLEIEKFQHSGTKLYYLYILLSTIQYNWFGKKNKTYYLIELALMNASFWRNCDIGKNEPIKFKEPPENPLEEIEKLLGLTGLCDSKKSIITHCINIMSFALELDHKKNNIDHSLSTEMKKIHPKNIRHPNPVTTADAYFDLATSVINSYTENRVFDHHPDATMLSSADATMLSSADATMLSSADDKSNNNNNNNKKTRPWRRNITLFRNTNPQKNNPSAQINDIDSIKLGFIHHQECVWKGLNSYLLPLPSAPAEDEMFNAMTL